MEEVSDDDPEVPSSTNVHRIGVEQHDGGVNSITTNSDDALSNV